MRALALAIALCAAASAGCVRPVLAQLSEPKLKGAYVELGTIFGEAGWACEDEKWKDGSDWLRCKSGRDILIVSLELVDGRPYVTFVQPWSQPLCKVAAFRGVVDKFNLDVPFASCECVDAQVLLIWTAMFLPDEGLPRAELPALAKRWHKLVTASAAKGHLLDDL